jgi:hypothetical protein
MPSQEGEPPPAEQADKGAGAATQPAVGDIPPSEEGQGGAGSGTAPQSGRKVEGAPGTAGQTGRSQGATQRSVAGTARGGADNEGPPPPEEPGLLDGVSGDGALSQLAVGAAKVREPPPARVARLPCPPCFINVSLTSCSNLTVFRINHTVARLGG